MWLEKLLDLLPWGERLWHRFRHPPRIEIDLVWDSLAPISTSDPVSFYRIITVMMIAGKAEEFVAADAGLEYRPAGSRDWVPLAPLSIFHSLPITVEPNRAWNGDLDGNMMATLLEEEVEPATSVEFRVTARDHHGTSLNSEPVVTSVKGLREEKAERR